ncbi:hypothetical protein AWB82_02759 [Caballeronia glebae]|uniref:Uncharacterized protein n=1 Tax=Caballeronia glebae TaxID=1777143 RepID=A0A158AQ53_9BURK|nr:hypothetical protein AWB82_02759 [Caballeronia glebae]
MRIGGPVIDRYRVKLYTFEPGIELRERETALCQCRGRSEMSMFKSLAPKREPGAISI